MTSIRDLMERCGYKAPEKSLQESFIKKHGITIAATVPYATGVIRMVTPDEAGRVLEREKPKKPEPTESKFIESIDEARDQIAGRELRESVEHLTRVTSQMRTELSQANVALELLIKQNNILTKKIELMLADLGVKDSGQVPAS